jgi:integrase/recombinase XerD
VASYQREVRFLAQYFPDIALGAMQQVHIEDYMLYIKVTLKCGRDKCRMAAQAFSFLWKHVFKKPFVLPSKLYPRKAFVLPDVMSPEEVVRLLASCRTIKQRAIVEVFYSSGVRLEECSNLKLTDIDSKNKCVHVHQGKGRKDRITLLSARCLGTLRTYYLQHRPQVYLFEGQRPSERMHPRSIQHAVEQCYKQAGMEKKDYSAHTLRHSFATHLLDAGVDIHTIKELLGHSTLASAVIYLHLQTKKRQALVSPLDALAPTPTPAPTTQAA